MTIVLSEYTDDMIARLFIYFLKNERYGGIRQRRALLQMIIHAARIRPDLPDPARFFKGRRLARGLYKADDMREFVMLVFDRMSQQRDPTRPQSQSEYMTEAQAWRDAIGGTSSG